jgi:hypothetical protein
LTTIRARVELATERRTGVSDPRAAHSADLLARMLGPAGEDLTCDECFEHLDRYVELDLSGGRADVAVPGMRSHLEGCPACREDRDSLAALLGSKFGRPHG